jgi:hypothetical protein
MKDTHTVDGTTLLDRFSEKVGALNFKNWKGFHPIIGQHPSKMMEFIKLNLDEADVIHFNMDGFRANNFKKFIKRSGSDLNSVPGRDNWLKNVTNWEFNTIMKSDTLRNKTIFYDLGGKPMPASQIQEIFDKAYRAGKK